jgi:hypothetical protein
MNCPALCHRKGPIHYVWLAWGHALLACLLLATTAVPAFSAVETDLSRPNVDGAPTRVRVGLYLADLHEVSASDETFYADVVVQAEWLDPRLAGRWTNVHGAAMGDVWNPRLTLANQRSVSALFPERVEIDPSGRVHWRQRWLGRFSARMNLKDFPMDRQRFQVQVVSLGYARDDVDLVVNSENWRTGRAKELSVTDWKVGPVAMEIADFETAPGEKALSGVHLWWEGQRYVRYYALQTIAPLVLIVLMGWTALWVDPSVVMARVSVSMTTMLTLISYRFSLGRSIPNLTYLTRFDYFMLASTILIFVILVLVAAGAYLVGKDKLALVRRIDIWARWAFPVLFGVVFVLAWWGDR